MATRLLKKEKAVSDQDVKTLRNTVGAIIEQVRKRGDAALREYARKFDGYDSPDVRVSPEEAGRAGNLLPPEVKEELDFAMKQVGAFAEAQKSCLVPFEKELYPGMRMGHRVVPVKSCGCYVPAGRYPCLTAAVMSVMPAKVAGVKRIVVCSSPGGAQAIAALAYGTETIRPVNLVVGPGNQYVMEAKKQVYGACGIDFLAGPSEVMVLADDTGSPEIIAADLLAQLEHDPNARGSLVTTSETLARKTIAAVEAQLRDLGTADVAGLSWNKGGEVAVCDSIGECAAYADEYAPEHLEIHTRNPREVMPLLHNYGSLFLGEQTAEVFADKISGTNHSLPTGAAAKYTGGLWVGNYLKVITHQESTDRRTTLMLARYAEVQAEYETMEAHRKAATIRIERYSAE
jgi:sulfopropanediol 3-dehydrogenase